MTSKREISLTVRFARSRAFGKATVGALGKSIGSTPASAYAVVQVKNAPRNRNTKRTDNFGKRSKT